MINLFLIEQILVRRKMINNIANELRLQREINKTVVMETCPGIKSVLKKIPAKTELLYLIYLKLKLSKMTGERQV